MKSDVSILIPSQGPSRFLSETLESILMSSTQPDEILIIDDGMTTEAKASIEKFLSLMPMQIQKSHGKGLVDALNTGLEVAKSNYICRIDNDDLMVENRIEIQLAHLAANEDVVAVGSQCVYINEKSLITGTSSYPAGLINEESQFRTKCLIAHPSTMYLKDAALSIGGYRSIFRWNGIDIAEDFDFWLRLSRVGRIEIIDEFLTKYRQHNSQLSSSSAHGVLIGTPYVSAVNMEMKILPQKIEFWNSRSKDELILLQTIQRNLGRKMCLATYLMIISSRRRSIWKIRYFQQLLLKIISSLSN
jgi:glycosyltransferase involved in cell wall biosynthesis